MSLTLNLTQTEETLNISFIGVSTVGVTLALIIEYGYGVDPCALCLTQRLLLFVSGCISVAGLAHNPRLGIYPVVALISIFIGAIFSLRHIYIQVNPEASGTCGMELEFLLQENYPWADVLNAMVSGTGSCAEASMIPVFALATFLILAVIAVKQLARTVRTSWTV